MLRRVYATPDRSTTLHHTSIRNQPVALTLLRYVAGIDNLSVNLTLISRPTSPKNSLVREAHVLDAIAPAPGSQGRRPHAPSVFLRQFFETKLISPSGRRFPQLNTLHTAGLRPCTCRPVAWYTGSRHSFGQLAPGTLDGKSSVFPSPLWDLASHLLG